MPPEGEFRFGVENAGDVSAIFERPQNARWLLVLAHGAGAGMRHRFLETLTRELAAVGVATWRYQFPYMEQRRRVPDAPAVLTATVRAAVRAAEQAAPDLPLLAGGKSMGGRMTSSAAAQEPLARVRGLIFFKFPLHPPGRPGTKRADHLAQVRVPMLFIQGRRDPLPNLNLLRPICESLGALATLEIIETADHSFHVLKRSNKNDAQIMRELAEGVAAWAQELADSM
jgi:predicted alpha/beta-hydrolase family hydrolase